MKKKLIFFSLLHFVSIYSWHCDLIELKQIIAIDEDLSYQKCSDKIDFEYKKLPFDRDHTLHPHKGSFLESYIVTIPQGQVYGLDGYVLYNDLLIQDFVWQNCFIPKYLFDEVLHKIKIEFSGTLAVLAQSGYDYYYHWLVEILGRLALLEINNIEYDFLYVPYVKPYMKQTLKLWGIPESKIIEASNDFIFKAEKLIVPSLIAKTETYGIPRLAHYMPKDILNYIKNKLLDGYKKELEKSSNRFNFCKKVFISRKDASARKILNENEIYKVFEQYGFQEYTLSQMSIVEQIALFENAEIIIGSLGSGMTNVLFCNSKVKIFDIFQHRCDCTIYYMCQTLGLEYHPIKTVNFVDDHDGQYDAIVPLEALAKIIQYL